MLGKTGKILFLLMICSSALFAQGKMTNQQIVQILHQEGLEWEGENGSWIIHQKDRILLLVTDEPNNRMRIFTPIAKEKDITPSDMRRMLKANFQSALDAKYSIFEGFVVSVFTHPLQELTHDQLLDAMQQVYSLAQTYGTTYSSTELLFGPAKPSEEKIPTPPPGEKRS